MRIHGWHTPTGLWLYGKQVEDVSRKYLDLRHRLLPYIYSGAADVTLHGSTLMRPLVMDFAQDDKAMEQKYEFMFGKELLVAPVLAPGVRDWDVYLPKDQHGWMNFWTGQKLQGGQTVKTSAKLDELPLFVRAGSIVPIGPAAQWANQEPDAPIEIRVYPAPTPPSRSMKMKAHYRITRPAALFHARSACPVVSRHVDGGRRLICF